MFLQRFILIICRNNSFCINRFKDHNSFCINRFEHHNSFCINRFKLGHPVGRAESDEKPKLIFTAEDSVNYSLLDSEPWREQVWLFFDNLLSGHEFCLMLRFPIKSFIFICSRSNVFTCYLMKKKLQWMCLQIVKHRGVSHFSPIPYSWKCLRLPLSAICSLLGMFVFAPRKRCFKIKTHMFFFLFLIRKSIEFFYLYQSFLEDRKKNLVSIFDANLNE